MTDNNIVFVKKPYRSGEKALTPNQVEILLEQVTDLYHLGLLQLAITTGIRREDIVRIKIKDVDIDNLSVTHYESKKKRTRTVYIPISVKNTLEMMTRISKSAYLFPGRKDTHISGRTAYNVFHRYLKKAGLDPRPFHALRATCYKLCQKKGWKPEEAAKHIGDTIRVAQEHYSVPSTEEMKAAATDKALI